jgi:hypothetical protein
MALGSTIQRPDWIAMHQVGSFLSLKWVKEPMTIAYEESVVETVRLTLTPQSLQKKCVGFSLCLFGWHHQHTTPFSLFWEMSVSQALAVCSKLGVQAFCSTLLLVTSVHPPKVKGFQADSIHKKEEHCMMPLCVACHSVAIDGTHLGIVVPKLHWCCNLQPPLLSSLLTEHNRGALWMKVGTTKSNHARDVRFLSL